MKKCCVCSRPREDAEMKQIVLTASEREYVKAKTGEDATDYWYCIPCFRVLSDREQGAQLIKGSLQVSLTARGHPRAGEISQKVYEDLLEKSKKGRPS